MKKSKDSSTKPFEGIVSDEENVAEIFNNFFVNMVNDLKISTDHNCNMNFQKIDNPVLNTMNKYKCHPSIIIKSKIQPESIFSFTPVQ